MSIGTEHWRIFLATLDSLSHNPLQRPNRVKLQRVESLFLQRLSPRQIPSYPPVRKHVPDHNVEVRVLLHQRNQLRIALLVLDQRIGQAFLDLGPVVG